MMKFEQVLENSNVASPKKESAFLWLYSTDIPKNSKGYEIAFLCQHRWNSTFGTMGGLIDGNETPLDAVIREAFEEIAFDCTPYISEIEPLSVFDMINEETQEVTNRVHAFKLCIPFEMLRKIQIEAYQGANFLTEVFGVNIMCADSATCKDLSSSFLSNLPFAGSAWAELQLLLA